MLETALIAFTTFFATIGPLDVAALFAALTANAAPRERRQMAVKGTFCVVRQGGSDELWHNPAGAAGLWRNIIVVDRH